ncbi:hypothetical protein KI387_028944, partial [Taxus chinensis]
MSTDRICAATGKKRKAAEDDEEPMALGFPPAFNPIISDRPASKPRLLLLCNVHDLENNEGCETPKSEEHQIPKNLSCPAAPRKPTPTPREKSR